MRKDKLYFLTFLSISVIFLFIASIASQYFMKVSANAMLETQVMSAKREAQQMAKIIDFQLSSNIDKDTVLKNYQQILASVDSEAWFLSIIDWSGTIICHPNITLVGQSVSSNPKLISALKEKDGVKDFYELLLNENTQNSTGESSSEVLFLEPTKNSDWIIAATINVNSILNQLNTLETAFYIILLVMGLVVIVLSFIAVRIIGSRYEKQLELNNSNLATEVLSLSKLNSDLVSYKEKIIATEDASQKSESGEHSKQRILTYIRNELVPILIEDIAYIYTENTITYIVAFDGKKSTSNASLDDLYSTFDATLFFRANRQFIISIRAIDKIIRYGKSQLKIVLHSNSSEEIIISKNKAAEFKQWLNI